jgi:hypothetical protein
METAHTPGLKRVAEGRYSVEPGRNIYRDGLPFVAISGQGRYVPVEADDFTREATHAVNCYEDMLEAIKLTLETATDIEETGGVEITHEAFTWLQQAVAKAEGK